MWITAAGVIVVLAVIWAAYVVGKRHGKTDQQKQTAELQAEDMASNAAIASKPDVDRPLSKLRPR